MNNLYVQLAEIYRNRIEYINQIASSINPTESSLDRIRELSSDEEIRRLIQELLESYDSDRPNNSD